MTVFRLALCFVLLTACSTAPEPKSTSAAQWSWLDRPLPEIAGAIARGELSSVQLVTAYQLRIQTIDRAGPTLGAVLSLNPNALKEAQRLDEFHATGGSAGPLHGVPILLKDNIESRDPLPTTAGSTALANNITGRDSPLVAGLRASGAIILGKANLSQWANYRSSASLSGWSAIGGQVRNPHILDRNPCGSSSGSGAAVAAALAAGAVGTETNGSIICPSNVNGIVGFKPTVGLVSAEHIVPVAFTQDTAGPMTRSVAGAAMMLDAMTDTANNSEYFSSLQDATLANVRLGVLRYTQGDHPAIIQRFESALQALQDAGAVLKDITEAPKRPEKFRTQARLVMDTEFKHSINAYLASTPPQVKTRTLAELIAYNNSNRSVEMPLFGQDIFEQAEASNGIDDPEYLAALAAIRTATREGGIDALLKEHNLHALIFPSGPLASPIDAINGDVWPNWVGDGASAAIAGYPHITVPMGAVRGVPIGLSFVASAGEDARVLGLGYAFEQATRLRVEPGYLRTAIEQPDLLRAMSGTSK